MTPLYFSSPLQKALDSGVTISGAFFDDDDYLDCVDDIRRERKANPIKTDYRAKEWIEMYPELKNDFERILLEKEAEKENLIKEARQRLKNVVTIRSGCWSLILTEKIKCEINPKLEKLNRDIRWLKLGLIVVDVNQNGLTGDQIQQARDFPIENLIETKKVNNTWCCPFHEEKTPSFHIYKENSWHCFGCTANGQNAIDFLLKKNKDMSFMDAVKYLIGK